MWRMIPLAKLVARMLVFGLALGVAEALLNAKLPWFGYPAGSLFPADMTAALRQSLTLGLALGIPLAVYAGVLHRRVFQPVLFRFAFVILGLTVSLLLVQPPFHLSFLLDEVGPALDLMEFASHEPWMALLLLITLAKHLAIGLTCLVAARRYMADAASSTMKARVQTLA